MKKPLFLGVLKDMKGYQKNLSLLNKRHCQLCPLLNGSQGTKTRCPIAQGVEIFQDNLQKTAKPSVPAESGVRRQRKIGTVF